MYAWIRPFEEYYLAFSDSYYSNPSMALVSQMRELIARIETAGLSDYHAEKVAQIVVGLVRLGTPHWVICDSLSSIITNSIRDTP